MRIGIIDTNAGNVTSLVACLTRLGHQTTPVRSDEDSDFDALVIPGQGHFGAVMTHVRGNQLDGVINEAITRGLPVVGICVGMQMLFDGSDEAPDIAGLGMLSGRAERLNSPKQPMVGWATLSGAFDDACVYFVNSFGIKSSDCTLASVTYGETFVAAVRSRDYPKVVGLQFHPEKSGNVGAAMLDDALNGKLAANNHINYANTTSALRPRVIACLDVANGRVVKGTNFINIKDMGDPVELACAYEAQGADEIVLLDISATLEQRQTALATVREVAKQLSIPFTVGGGLNAYSDVAAFLDAGADKVALNSAAVKSPELITQIAEGFGSQCAVVAIDAKQTESGDYRVFTHGGKRATELDAIEWATRAAELGAGEILMTAMHRDGTGLGFDNELMQALSRLPIQVIASGGAANAQHFVDTFRAGSDAALAAGMFHRGEVTIGELKQTLQQAHIEVRAC